MPRTSLLLALLLPGIAGAEDLPAYILQLPDAVESVLIAETDTSRLHRYRRGERGLEAMADRYMSVGQNGVGKQRAWDRRTPLGIYFANEQLDTSRLHEKYGPIAFPLDYPNAWDDRNKRTGDGIWIHGVSPGDERRPPRDTDGCISLPNADLLDLEKHLQLLITPVIITRSLQRVTAEQIAATRNDLNAAIDAWVSSFVSGDWHRYLSLYAEDFAYRGLDREQWSAYRVRAAETRPISGLHVDDVLLLADPEEEGLYLSRFRQTIVDDNGQIVTIKRLYWRRAADGQLRIVAEDNG